MEVDDIPAGLALCRAARWNQTAHDWEAFLRLEPGGARVATEGGRVIGTVATLRYERRFAWVAMVLVDPAARGRGVGTGLLHEGLRILADMRSTRLDATPAGRMLYLKLGFQDEYALSRMEAVIEDAERAARDDGGPPVRALTDADLPAVRAFDHDVFGADRGRLLEWFFEGAPSLAFISRTDQRVRGYALGRHGFNFEHVGPVVAESLEVARSLVSASLAGLRGRHAILDAPHHSRPWLDWLAARGFKEQRPFTRMYLGENAYPGLPEKQFASLGPEFG
jgi:GNAT superfamily N-acetyltransferase